MLQSICILKIIILIKKFCKLKINNYLRKNQINDSKFKSCRINKVFLDDYTVELIGKVINQKCCPNLKEF